jgi:prepilin-type N-terminal cleavage/methylation domain-containing protein
LLEILRNTSRRRAARRRTGRVSTAGFTLLEIVIALVLVAAVYAVALPAIGRTRVSASVHNSRYVVESSIALARATAIRFGRTAQLHLDSAADRVWVEADTTLAGSGGEAVRLGYFDIAGEYNVDLQSNRNVLCFNSRGIGTTGASCPQTGATVVLSMQGRADTVRVSPTGWILP